MAAHLNITSNIATVYGVTLGGSTEADDCGKTQTVEISTVADAATAEIIEADPVNVVATETTVSGEGPHSLTLTPGTVSTPGDLTVIGVEVSESPNARCQFTVRAAGHASFTDPSGTVSVVGAEPTLADLEITSVAYSIAESVRRSADIQDMVLIGTDGTPAARATVQATYPFSVTGRGDLPAGVALGTGSVEFVGGDSGKVLCSSLTTGEKRADWNRWGVDGTHYLAA